MFETVSESKRKKQLPRLTQKIGQDLTEIYNVLFDEDDSHRKEALARQRDKYLFGAKERLLFQDHLYLLRQRFTTKLGETNFDVGDVKWGLLREGNIKLFSAFGIYIRATNTIRIAPKAFLLPDSILCGVILHEATHLDLRTQDHAYDNSVRPGHKKLKELSDDLKYDNADNWRIFYQKCIKHLGR